jgi:hypothetical protein
MTPVTAAALVRRGALAWLVVATAACVPVSPAAAPAGPWAGGLGASGFGPLTPELVQRVGRPAGQGPRSLAATGIRLGWAAPEGQQGGNWAFDVVVGAPVQGAGPGASGSLVARALPPTPESFESALAAHVLPVTSSWAADARRVDTPEPGSGGPAVFVSEAQRETLSVYLGPEGGACLRVAWADAPAVAEAQIGATQALAALEEALRQPNAPCEEAASGVDAFTGVPFVNPVGLPSGCLTIRGLAGAVPRVEPEGPRPFAAPVLVRHLGRLAWRIEEAAPAHCRVGPTLNAIYDVGHGPGFLRVEGAGGWVDARTGRVLRWRRAYRVYDVEGV